MRRWKDYPEYLRNKVRRKVAELAKNEEDTFVNEAIEDALKLVIPELKNATVEDDAFHELITEIHAEYIRGGATDE